MERGVPLISQAALTAGGWLGYADFLVRVGKGCPRWAWSFEPWDAILARTPRPEHLFQLLYGDLLGAERGAPLPDSGEDALSNGFELGLTLGAWRGRRPRPPSKLPVSGITQAGRVCF